MGKNQQKSNQKKEPEDYVNQIKRTSNKVSKLVEYFNQAGDEVPESAKDCLLRQTSVFNQNDEVTRLEFALKFNNQTYSLYNPWDISSNQKYLNTEEFGRSIWVWKKVDRPVWDKYIEFLKTQNPIHLNTAKRLLEDER